ncbi:MAG: hypothetical protein KF799_06795 [Bdellovibrionales bacterium]|nr:hypothetical protein [Bdellovibrionales bacterium]
MNARLFALHLLLLTACTQTITRPSQDISFSGDRLLYKGQAFSGVVQESFTAAEITRRTHYKNGLPNGSEEEFFRDGQLATHREYTDGIKTGVHKGWFASGQRRFHYEYIAGKFHGEVWEWYASGKLSQYMRFEEGQALGKKMWRENGQIYTNLVFPKGHLQGLPGTKLCYQTRDGKF